jgi:hypothetical protein
MTHPQGDVDLGVPGSAVFYDDLDTVRFGSDVPVRERKAREVSATGTLMLGLLVGNAPLLLSQPQGFDNSLILRLAADHQDRDGRRDWRAFLRLARAGFVRVGILDRSLRDDSPDGERHTLLNAFRTALGNKAFVFSGWPELNDPELRPQVLDRLDRAPRRLDGLVGSDVAARVDGLLEFDRNLRQRPETIKIIKPGSGENLKTRVSSILHNGDPDSTGLRAAVQWIIGQAEERGVELNARSNWYRLADEYHSQGHMGASAVKNSVDGHYNAIVGESLDPGGLSITCKDDEAARLLATRYTPDDETGQLRVTLTQALGHGEWLRWADIPQLLSELSVLDDESQRLSHLEAEYKDWFGKDRSGNQPYAAVKLALPTAIAAYGIDFVRDIITGVHPGQAAEGAAVTGTVVLIAAVPLLREATKRYQRKIEQSEGGSWEKTNSIRTGSAAWLEEIQHRHIRR